MQIAGLLNGTNINQDYMLSMGIEAMIVAPGAIVSGLAVTTNTVAVGKAIIRCTRTNGQVVFVAYSNTASVTIDSSGTKKVWVEVSQAKLDDGSANATDGTGIAVVNTGDSYPTGNYMPLASIAGGVITDGRPNTTLASHVVQGILKLSLSASIASATTTNLAILTGNTAHVTGTTTITSFGTLPAGTEICLIFDGILTLTHNATSLILLGSANITTVAGDIAYIISEGSGNWRLSSYTRGNGDALQAVASTKSNFTAGENITIGMPVYILPADGKVYKTDGSSSTKLGFIGFANSTVTIGQTVTVNISGVDTNQSGLSAGSQYFIGSTGSAILDAHGRTIATFGSQTALRGIRIFSKYAQTLTTVTKKTSTAATRCFLKSDAGTTLSNVTFSGDIATFSYSLAANTYYRLECDNNGSSYNSYFDVNSQINKSNINFVGGSDVGANTTTWFTIIDVTTTWTSTAGSITTIPLINMIPVGRAVSSTTMRINSGTGQPVQGGNVTPTVTASPYTYQNTTGYPSTVTITGGTVSAVSISRDNFAFFQIASATNTSVVLGVNDYLTITYTVAPILTVFAISY